MSEQPQPTARHLAAAEELFPDGGVGQFYSGDMEAAKKDNWKRFAAIIAKHEQGANEQLLGECALLLKGLIIGTEWEIAPQIKSHMIQLEKKVCAAISAAESHTGLTR